MTEKHNIDLQRLRHLVASFPDQPPMTIALEKRIKIGAGFHNKWYRSQKEHWLGWLSLKSRENVIYGKNFEPRRIWSGLKCSPMLFWMAEVSGVDMATLTQLEAVSIQAAKTRPSDGNPHGVEFRKILPFDDLARHLVLFDTLGPLSEAQSLGENALRRLSVHLPQYQKYVKDSEVLD